MTAPSVVLQLAPLDRIALTMEHVAKEPKLIRRVGDKGAAIVAYVCRELAANVAEHGQSNRPGRMELHDGLQIKILFPGPEFDSTDCAGGSGGLTRCRELLKRSAVRWTHDHRDGENITTLVFSKPHWYG